MTTPPTDQQLAVDRVPIAHSVVYAVRGLPEVPNQYGSGTLEPREITLTYRTAPDSQLGRVHAYVAGRIWVDGAEIPLLPGGLYGQHYDDGLDGWPEWLAEEARLHDPAAETERLRERHKAGLRRADEINNELMEEVQRYAAGTERPVLWSVYNRMHGRAAHAEGALGRVRRIASRLAAHAVGFQDVLDESDRGPWGRTVGADIAELSAAVAPDAASVPPGAPVSASQPSSVSESAQSPTGAATGRLGDSGPEAPPRRTLTPHEYDSAWHAVEGAAGDEGADPGTILHAVLDRLGIQWQDAAMPAATSTPAR